MIDELITDFAELYNGDWKSALVVSIIILIVGIVLHIFIFKVLNKIIRKKDQFVLKNFRDKFRIPSLVLIIIISLQIIVFSFAPDSTIINTIKHVLKLLLIFSVSWLLMQVISFGKDSVLRRFDIYQKDNLKARRVFTQFKIIEGIIHFIIILISVGTALTTFESIRKIGVSLFASAGVAGIILGFAAQKLIGTILAGFQIAITQPIRIDDVVIVENEWGWIEEINLTYVVVRIWDKRRMVLPTTYFIEKPFQNWTRASSDISGTVFIYADYTVPFGELRNELTRILEQDENWDRKINNMQVTNATEKTVEIRALVSAADSPSAWDLRVNVREKLIEFLQEKHPDCLPKSRVTLESKSENVY